MLRYHGFPFWDTNEAIAMIPGPVALPIHGVDIFSMRDANYFLSNTNILFYFYFKIFLLFLCRPCLKRC